LFIDEVKSFAFAEFGFELKGDLYCNWSDEDGPFFYIYISRQDSILKPKDFDGDFIYCKTNESYATAVEESYRRMAYDTFRYRAYANSATLINRRFLSYSKDAIAFIVLHELTHNYIRQKKMNMPYEFNEALCDVIGNYGAWKFAQSNKNIDTTGFKIQIKVNEDIYKCLNFTISGINTDPSNSAFKHKVCTEMLSKILSNGNSFQKDRFDHPVNNAYLLKNEYYCKNYFLLKKVFLKQGSIKDFLRVMELLPERNEEQESYLLKHS
jgi:hypothetical protein